MKSIRITANLAVLVLLGVVACKKPAPTQSPLVSPLGSPISAPEIPSPTSQVTGPGFLIDQPVLPGAIEVTGQGPIGLTIFIVDMTMEGNSLGSGKIGSDGKFSISLDEPAIENHVIGIQVAADREFSPQDIEQLRQRKGPGFKTYPQVGDAYDSAIVRNPE